MIFARYIMIYVNFPLYDIIVWAGGPGRHPAAFRGGCGTTKRPIIPLLLGVYIKLFIRLYNLQTSFNLSGWLRDHEAAEGGVDQARRPHEAIVVYALYNYNYISIVLYNHVRFI
jgi:hypothetical protein